MMRFLRSKIPLHDAKHADVEEFINCVRTFQHGFPLKASTCTYDYCLSLLAIGTKDGQIRVYGAANVEWSARIPEGGSVAHVYFASGTGRLFALCDDQRFHLFRLSGTKLEHVDSCHNHRLKMISACEMQFLDEGTANLNGSSSRLLVGTITGNVYSLFMDKFEMSDFIIYEDTVLQCVPENRRDAGAIVQMAVNSTDPKLLLIGYKNGLIVYYDTTTHQVFRCFEFEPPLTHLHWHADGRNFYAAHGDGSYVKWSLDEQPASSNNKNTSIPFGPYPCMPIDKILITKTIRSDEDLVIFSGGMPKASFGDRYTVSAQNDEAQVVFDFSSRVLDIIAIPAKLEMEQATTSAPSIALLVLCEEELVMIDLTERRWRTHRLPYLYPLHSAPLSSAVYVGNVEERVWRQIIAVGDAHYAAIGMASAAWPITGGRVAAGSTEDRQLLITGHENGTVKFWSAGTISMRHLLTVSIAKEFGGGQFDEANTQRNDDDSDIDDVEWPPFRKVGLYDPFCDDPRLAVQKIEFDPINGQLVIGGAGGFVLLMNYCEHAKEIAAPEILTVDIVSPSELAYANVHTTNGPRGGGGLGHQILPGRKDPGHYPGPGYHPGEVQLQLQAVVGPVTALAALNSERQLVAIGSAYGFALVELKRRAVLLRRCLLSLDDISTATALDGALTRFKTLKKSLRESFRRRRRVPGENKADISDPALGSSSKATSDDGADIRPVEREIEARPKSVAQSAAKGELLPSLVRIIKFYNTFVSSAATRTDSLWIGTNGGLVCIYALPVSSTSHANNPDAICDSSGDQVNLIKELHLRHRAPIIALAVANVDGSPISKAPGCHKVIVCTEEQLKAFTLPALKPTRYKYKLTGLEGSRIRKVQLAQFQSVNDGTRAENFLLVFTNQGELHIFSAVTFRRFFKAGLLKVTDVAGILSTVLTSSGDLLYLRSGGTEWQRVNLPAKQSLLANFELPELIAASEQPRNSVIVNHHQLNNNNSGTLPQRLSNGCESPQKPAHV